MENDDRVVGLVVLTADQMHESIFPEKYNDETVSQK
jgi:hypothetical protein